MSSTCYSPVRHSGAGASSRLAVRLACLRRAASVRSEPGSNSPSFIHKTPKGLMTLSSPSLAYSRNPAPFQCAVSILGLRGGLSATAEPAAGLRNTLKRMPLLALFLSFPLLSNIPAPGLSVLQDHRFIASKKDYISFSLRLSIPWIRFFSFFSRPRWPSRIHAVPP